MALLPLLREHGIDPQPVLKEFGYDVAFFEEPENTLPSATMGALLGRCAELCRCPHLGLLVGQRGGISVLGAVGFLMQSSSDVGSALQSLERHLHAHDRGALVRVTREGGFALLGYSLVQGGVDQRHHILDGSMCIGQNLMQALCGPGWHATEVRFSHAPPVDVTPYRQFFRTTPRFNAEQTALVFPAHWLARPIPSADPLLHRMMEQRVLELAVLGSEDLVQQLRRLLGAWSTERDLSIGRVAAYIGINVRTLNRRLAAAGLTFAQLRDEARCDVARGLLRDTEMAVGDIADLLAYSETSAFTRAFRRWTGHGPAAWRRTARQPAAAPR